MRGLRGRVLQLLCEFAIGGSPGVLHGLGVCWRICARTAGCRSVPKIGENHDGVRDTLHCLFGPYLFVAEPMKPGKDLQPKRDGGTLPEVDAWCKMCERVAGPRVKDGDGCFDLEVRGKNTLTKSHTWPHGSPWPFVDSY